MKRLVVLAALVLAGCASPPPRLMPPDRVDSFCSGAHVSPAAAESVLSSVGDRIDTSVAWPGEAELHTDVEQNGGAVAYWKSQPLYMPFTAKVLGVDGNYIDVTRVVIDNQLMGVYSRLIYVTVATPRGNENVILRAFDTRNICVEGRELE